MKEVYVSFFTLVTAMCIFYINLVALALFIPPAVLAAAHDGGAGTGSILPGVKTQKILKAALLGKTSVWEGEAFGY